MLTVAQNIPTMLVYLPPQLTVSSQVCFFVKSHKVMIFFYIAASFSLQMNQSQSGVAGLAEVLSGRRRRLWALGELAATDSGYRQAIELRHTYPQVFLSRNILMHHPACMQSDKYQTHPNVT